MKSEEQEPDEVVGIPIDDSITSLWRPPSGGTTSGGSLDATNHLALLYADFAEQMSTVAPFLERGLERDERCLYIADDHTEAEVVDALQNRGIDVETARESDALSIYTADRTYLQTGEFDRDGMLDFLRDALSAARDDGHTGVRAAAEMTWALESDTDRDQLATYESQLNRLYADDDYTGLCQYDRTRFPTDVLSDVVHTHPLVVTDGTAYPNVHYTPPDDFHEPNLSTVDVDRTLDRLRGRTAVSAGDTFSQDSDSRPGETHVLLSLADHANERVLADWLAERSDATVTVGSPSLLRDRSFDLCLFDEESFSRHRDVLIEQKEAAEPQILPYLLVHRGDAVPRDADLRECVDEALTMPTDKETLAWRIDTLLRLRDTSRRLARKNEQIEQLASAAAHDLRNPLSVAMGWLDRVDDDGVVEKISRAHDRMEGLIENVLAIAKTGEPVTDDDLEPVEFPTLLRGSWESVPTERAVLHLDDGLPKWVRIHPTYCRQIFENLYRNAVTHGGDDVRVRVGPIDGGRGFYVADDGPGIPPDERDDVFDEGYTTASGSGLGLVVVNRVAEYHGWSVFLTESRWGGARFEFLGLERESPQ